MFENEIAEDRCAGERWKRLAAWALLTLPFFACPLVWSKAWRSHVPYWDEAMLFGCPALALSAAAALLLVGPKGLRLSCGRSKLNASLALLSAVLWAISLCRAFSQGVPPDYDEWFVFLMPLAGIALSGELLRILPLFGTLALGVLIFFTFRFSFFTGLVGNWNWNLSLLTVLVPAPFLLFFRLSGKKMWLPIAAAAVWLTVFSLLRPELAPRGVIAGVVAASALLWILWKVPRRQRLIIICLAGGAGLAMFFSVWLGPADSTVRSSRVWLWRGAAEFALAHSATGVGYSNFERHINPYLPKEYYFSDFAVERHTHPHNEILAVWSGFGVSGAIFLVILVVAATGGLHTASATRIWVFWMFFVLLIHGQFDVLLSTPLAGTLFLLSGGALAGGTSRGVAPCRFAGAVGGIVALGGAILMFCSGLYSREAWFLAAAGEKNAAREYLYRSLSLFPTPQTRYRTGMVEFFDFKSPRAAISQWEKLSPCHVHSNGYLARAYAVSGDSDKALEYFARENLYYPMSALNAFWELEVLKRTGCDPRVLLRRREHLNYLLKLRGLSIDRIDELILHPALDDAPLRNP